MTGPVIRTTYGFMAAVIGLFLSSLCVIKVVRPSSPFRFLIWVLTIFAETRDRTVQEDRCKAWGKGICLRRILTIRIPSLRIVSCQRWQYIFLSCTVSDLASLVDTVFDIPFLYHSPFLSFNMFLFSVASRVWLSNHS